MSRSADVAKRREWSARLERFERRGEVTVGAFCAEEGVSLASLYSWRRKLGGRGTGRTPAASQGSAAPAAPAPSFVPVRMAPRGVPQPTVRLRLPNGARLWLPAGDASLLAAAIAAAGGLGASCRMDEASHGEDEAC